SSSPSSAPASSADAIDGGSRTGVWPGRTSTRSASAVPSFLAGTSTRRGRRGGGGESTSERGGGRSPATWGAPGPDTTAPAPAEVGTAAGPVGAGTIRTVSSPSAGPGGGPAGATRLPAAGALRGLARRRVPAPVPVVTGADGASGRAGSVDVGPP